MENTIKTPMHIAIIPDGNRRWAKKRLLSPWIGHRKGSEILEELVDVVIEFNIPYVTFWGSSKDNMAKRPKEEVKYLLDIFKDQFNQLAESKKVHDNEIRIDVIGAWREQFPEDVKKSIENAIDKTRKYGKFLITFMLAYSGTDEIISAFKKIASEKDQKIDAGVIKNSLMTKDLPPVDLLIRSGGEPHNSDGFMMWHTANSQFFFSEKLWPDFDKNDLREAIKEYARRERRLGS